LKLIKNLSNKLAPAFQKGGKLEIFYPLFEVMDTFMLTPDTRTQHGPHIRDKIDSKRFMITVVIALIPAILIGMYNIGLQAQLAKGTQATVLDMAGCSGDHFRSNYR
jgi:Na+-transporting NADH:ubiquinone oxidoreductase subunit B